MTTPRNRLHQAPASARPFFPAFSAVSLLIALAASFAAAANSPATGTIEGRVLNARSGDYAENARITVEGTSLETFTDADGYYRLSQVATGTARVRAFFTGLPPQLSEVRVGAAETIQHDITLAALAPRADPGGQEAIRLAEFVVGASREMEAAAIAINEQRFAANIKNVVSTDEFGHVAEGNVGEFLKFLPGVTVEYGGGYARGISLDGVPSANVPITIDGFNLASTGGPNNTGRSVQVDMASINNIARLEVSFSPTPEAQGAALAGSVNMVPRSSFERARPVFNYTVAMVMRDNARHFDKTPGPREHPTRKVHPSFDFSYVRPVNKRFGFTLTGGTARQYTAEDFNQNAWRGGNAATNGNAFPHTTPDQPYLSSYVVRDAPKDTIRRSFGFTTDYKLTRDDRISFSFQFFSFNADTTSRTLTFNANRVLPGDFSPRFTHGAPGAGDLQLAQGGRDRINRTWMPSLVWRHDGRFWKAEAGAGHSQGTNRVRDIDKGFFNNTQARRSGVTVSFDDIAFLRPGRISVTDSIGGRVDPYRIDSYALVSSNSVQNDTTDTKRSAYASTRRDFYALVPFTLKAGVDVRQWERDLRGSTRLFSFVGADGRASTAPAAGDDAAAPYLDPSFSQRVLPFGHPAAQWTSNEKLWALYQARPDFYSINPDAWYRSAVSLSKYVEELISAAYVRGDVQLFQRRLKLVGGIRAEQTNIEAEGPLTDPTRNHQRDSAGRVILGSNGRPLPIVPASNALGVSELTFVDRGQHAEKEYLRLFPSLNASFNVRDNLIARAAYYQSVGRPDFNQYAGGITLPDTENPPANNNRITVNNIGIKAWDARTVKVRLEYYFEGVGQISIGAFRRNFENFFGNVVFPATPDFLALYSLDPAVYGGYDVSTQHNITSTVRMEGFNIDYKQVLTFLPSWARGVQVFANANSQRALGDDTGDFAGYVPRSASWGVSLTRPKFNVRMNWNYRGRQRANRVAAGASIAPDTFNWEVERLYLDLSAEYNLRRRLALFASLRNVTGEYDDTEVYGSGTPAHARLRQRTDIGALWTVGVKGSF
ncbi:MAG: TonB-dependent receptor [Opitutaceae bacterium]|nr:TonB-dependent receptor [Opitutaceae bacterium]